MNLNQVVLFVSAIKISHEPPRMSRLVFVFVNLLFVICFDSGIRAKLGY